MLSRARAFESPSADISGISPVQESGETAEPRHVESRGASSWMLFNHSGQLNFTPHNPSYIMSDSETKSKAGVPSWQLQKALEAEEKNTDDNSKTQAEEPSRTELVESAKKFLEEDDVKDATTDKKISFLESKGLRNDEIEQLLGVARNVEASNPAASEVCFITRP